MTDINVTSVDEFKEKIETYQKNGYTLDPYVGGGYEFAVCFSKGDEQGAINWNGTAIDFAQAVARSFIGETLQSDNEILNFYAKKLSDHRMYDDFCGEISSIADRFEHTDFEKRQETVMGDMMLVFDKVCMKNEDDRYRYASEMFRDASIDDELTVWQLKMIKGVCADHWPNIVASCDDIIENGC